MPKALEGIRILESGRYFAAPLVGTLLGDMGAEVIRYEEPGQGDPLRYGYHPLVKGIGPYFLWSARNKKSITLDLRKKRGQELFKELAKISDVVTENFRPGTLAKWGLDYEEIRKVNPGIIMLSVSMYGATGPYAQRPGRDYIAQAASGLMSVTGEPDGPATFYGIAIVDYIAGFLNTYAVLTALHYKQKTGQGQWIDNSLLESAAFCMEHKILHFTSLGEVAWRKGARIATPGVRTYEAKDGDVLITGGQQRAQLLKAIGREDILSHPLFPKHSRDPLDAKFIEDYEGAVAQWVKERTTKEIEEILVAADIEVAPVNTVADLVSHPQYQARNALVEVEHPTAGKLKFQGPAPKLSLTPGAVEKAAPLLGEDNDYVYGKLLGLNEQERENLKAEGVI
ncbi:MAG: CoA transferase [Chloroflexi bacterium]|nr:CoA transferase [Chloroflexota bacterium]